MVIGACSQINIRENVFVCVSAFVMKTSYFIEHKFSGWSHTIIEGCDCAKVVCKYMRGYVVAIGYIFTCELQTVKTCSNNFEIFYWVSCGVHGISSKNALLWIPRFRVQGLTVLYPK